MDAQAADREQAMGGWPAPESELAAAGCVADRLMAAAMGALDILAIAPALAAVRRLAGRTGTVLIADMKTAHQFTAPGSDLERLLYGFSLLICLPDSMSTPGSPATGTVLRPGTMSDYAGQAGYTRTDILPIDHNLWRFYRLHQKPAPPPDQGPRHA
jgi:hypothetical protein